MAITVSNVKNLGLRAKFLFIFVFLGVVLGAWGGFEYGYSKLSKYEQPEMGMYAIGYVLTTGGLVSDWNKGWKPVATYVLINNKYNQSAEKMTRVIDRTLFPFSLFGLIIGIGFYNYFSKKMGE